MEDKLSTIKNSTIKKRFKAEIQLLIDYNLCDFDDINVETNDEYYGTRLILRDKSFNVFKFCVPNYYPFKPPELYINDNKYLSSHTILSNDFKLKLKKYTGIDCFCCDTVLCSNNWSPKYTFKYVLDERNKYKNACREVVHRIFVDVIKRKYLVNDVNIVQWLY